MPTVSATTTSPNTDHWRASQTRIVIIRAARRSRTSHFRRSEIPTRVALMMDVRRHGALHGRNGAPGGGRSDGANDGPCPRPCDLSSSGSRGAPRAVGGSGREALSCASGQSRERAPARSRRPKALHRDCRLPTYEAAELAPPAAVGDDVTARGWLSEVTDHLAPASRTSSGPHRSMLSVHVGHRLTPGVLAAISAALTSAQLHLFKGAPPLAESMSQIEFDAGVMHAAAERFPLRPPSSRTHGASLAIPSRTRDCGVWPRAPAVSSSSPRTPRTSTFSLLCSAPRFSRDTSLVDARKATSSSIADIGNRRLRRSGCAEHARYSSDASHGPRRRTNLETTPSPVRQRSTSRRCPLGRAPLLGIVPPSTCCSIWSVGTAHPVLPAPRDARPATRRPGRQLLSRSCAAVKTASSG